MKRSSLAVFPAGRRQIFMSFWLDSLDNAKREQREQFAALAPV